MDWEALIAAACRFLEALIGSIGTILMIALGVGLVCLAIGLTIAVLWRHLSLGLRTAIFQVWAELRRYMKETAVRHFHRIRRYGHTHWSAWLAVVCSLVMWLGIVVAFTFTTYWRAGLVVLLLLPVVFFAAGWLRKGPNATKYKFRFACAFFEPAVALAAPTLTGKVIDAVLKSITAAF